MSRKTGYSGLQIGLHWLVAILILAAYFSSDGMGQVLRERVASGATGTEGNTPHVWLGGAVFALVLLRIVVRLIQGAPGAPPGTAPWLEAAATWGHRLIYLLMLATPALGAVTWYGGVRAAGDLHEWAGTALVIVALGHAVVAILHEAFLSDGTLQRMFSPGK